MLFDRRAIKDISLVVPVDANWLQFFFVEIAVVATESQLT